MQIKMLQFHTIKFQRITGLERVQLGSDTMFNHECISTVLKKNKVVQMFDPFSWIESRSINFVTLMIKDQNSSKIDGVVKRNLSLLALEQASTRHLHG